MNQNMQSTKAGLSKSNMVICSLIYLFAIFQILVWQPTTCTHHTHPTSAMTVRTPDHSDIHRRNDDTPLTDDVRDALYLNPTLRWTNTNRQGWILVSPADEVRSASYTGMLRDTNPQCPLESGVWYSISITNATFVYSSVLDIMPIFNSKPITFHIRYPCKHCKNGVKPIFLYTELKIYYMIRFMNITHTISQIATQCMINPPVALIFFVNPPTVDGFLLTRSRLINSTRVYLPMIISMHHHQHCTYVTTAPVLYILQNRSPDTSLSRKTEGTHIKCLGSDTPGVLGILHTRIRMHGTVRRWHNENPRYHSTIYTGTLCMRNLHGEGSKISTLHTDHYSDVLPPFDEIRHCRGRYNQLIRKTGIYIDMFDNFTVSILNSLHRVRLNKLKVHEVLRNTLAVIYYTTNARVSVTCYLPVEIKPVCKYDVSPRCDDKTPNVHSYYFRYDHVTAIITKSDNAKKSTIAYTNPLDH